MHSGVSSTNPSAEEFLRQLILFIDSIGSELLANKAPFKLQPRALEYLALRLDRLFELQRAKTSNPIRFLAGAVADLTDFLRMEKVQQFCSLVQHLKLYSSSQDVRDPTPVNFFPFTSISTLEIRGCDLSSSNPHGVDQIRPTVERIICQNSLECLWHLLNPTLDQEAHWPKLTSFSCLYNDLVEIDSSMKTAENLTSLDLSRNRIDEAQNLQQLSKLTALDLSFNSLSTLGEIPYLSRLVRLFLQSNGVRSLEGIDRLEALEELDLRWNVLSSWSDVVKLKKLTRLREVCLDGNPLSTAHHYRIHVLACLQGVLETVSLDGRVVSDLEKKKVRKMSVSDDGRLEETTNENIVLSSRPSYFWDFLFSFRNPFARRLESLERYDSLPLLMTDEEEIGERSTQRPVKRIVDIPTTSYISTCERLGDSSRLTPTSSGAKRQSRDISHVNGRYEGEQVRETMTFV